MFRKIFSSACLFFLLSGVASQTLPRNDIFTLPDTGYLQYSVEELPEAQNGLYTFLGNCKKEAVEMFPGCPEKAYDMRWEAMNELVEWVRRMSLYYSQDHPSFSGLAYDCTLLSKSIQLHASRYRNQLVRESGDPQLIAAWNTLKAEKVFFEGGLAFAEFTEYYRTDSVYKARLAVLEKTLPVVFAQMKQVETTLRARNDSLVHSWKDYLEKERRLLNELKNRGASDIDLEVNWKDVREVLAENEVAIEIVSIDGNIEGRETLSRLYAALLVRHDSPFPQIVYLVREHTGVVSNIFDIPDPDDLAAWVWNVLSPCLSGIDTIYMAPAGLLHAISFAGVKDPDQGYVTDRVLIRHLLTTRDIIDKKQQQPLLSEVPGKALFVGGADFDLTEAELSSMDREEIPAQENAIRAIPEHLRAQGLDYLPGSVKELCGAADMLARNQWKTAVFVDRYATKKQILSAVETFSPDVLHISTHGFYFPPLSESHKLPVGFFEEYSVMESVFRSATQPLMRCGLFFAGANRVWTNQTMDAEWENGILTGYEISQLDLSQARLVILSACSTGMGDIDHREGVLGLQRAFRMAGVGNMLVSRWEIPDKETEELISAFYQLWLPGVTVKEAFDGAQRQMRETYPDDSYKWAGFLLIE